MQGESVGERGKERGEEREKEEDREMGPSSFCSLLFSFQMHGYGTNLEGPFPVVSRAIEACHEAVHAMGVSGHAEKGREKGGRGISLVAHSLLLALLFVIPYAGTADRNRHTYRDKNRQTRSWTRGERRMGERTRRERKETRERPQNIGKRRPLIVVVELCQSASMFTAKGREGRRGSCPYV
jgi:hypothetical protein